MPDGAAVDGVPLRVARNPDGSLRLTWSASCRPSDDDYAVYEGAIGDFRGHASTLCTSGGLTEATVPDTAGDRYYLVVPRTGQVEGSYGQDSEGIERPVALAGCVPAAVAPCR